MPRKINLAEAFGRIDEHYSPRIAGEVNDFQIKIVKVQGQFVWHHHEQEDELVYMLEGEAVLIEDEGETVLKPGDVATFKAGVHNGHHIVNRSDRDALFLEIGTRSPNDSGEYPDIDMKAVKENGVGRYLHKDGTPY